MAEHEHPARKHYQLQFERRADGVISYPQTPEEATHAIVLIRHRELTSEITFEMGETEKSRRQALHKRHQVERLIQMAYERGDNDARADVRRALGIR